jgi:hypothetical protein
VSRRWQRLGDRLRADLRDTGAIARRSGGGELERPQRDARVAVGQTDERVERFGSHRHVLRAQAALRIVERALDDAPDVVVVECAQHEDARTREQRRVDLERRVLGRGADERDRAVLDVRQHRVLLRLVEAVDLVDEQHRATARRAQSARVGDDAPQIGDAGADSRHRRKVCPRLLCDDACQRRLPGAGRSPQDHRRDLVRLDRHAQRTSGPDDLFLTDELIERTRPHARSQRFAHRAAVAAVACEHVDHRRRTVPIDIVPATVTCASSASASPARLVSGSEPAA